MPICVRDENVRTWRRPTQVGSLRLPAEVGHFSAPKGMHRDLHEWPEKQPGVKKKQNLCGLNPILWRFAAEEGAIRADDQSWCPTVAEFALHR